MAQSDISVVGEAKNPESGIEMVNQFLSDVVAIDIRLRQDSGIEVAKKLRAYASWLLSASTAISPRRIRKENS
jgi:DNA-binding NarL/FixJ family response regulator